MLSADNERALEDVHDKVEEARCMIRAFLDKSKKKPDATEDDDPNDDAAAAESERALRERKARARAALHAHEAESPDNFGS